MSHPTHCQANQSGGGTGTNVRSTFTSARREFLQRKCACGGNAGSSGECEECRKKKLQRKACNSETAAQSSAFNPRTSEVPPIVHEVLRSPGEPLDAATRQFMEPRFGHDFSGVRVHTDAKAAGSARAVNALAYTLGQNLVFNTGQYAPATNTGRQLLAHELTHVLQQRGSSEHEATGIMPGDMMAEREAEAVGRAALTRPSVGAITQSAFPGLIGRAAADNATNPQATGASPAAGGASGAQPSPTPPQRLRIDILGADTAVNNFLARAAAAAIGTDLRVTSLDDMVNKLESMAGSRTGRCIEHLAVWNHGKPGLQVVAGEETIRTREGKTIKLPRSGFDLDWLLTSGNQAALTRLRSVFCCGGEMEWLGCGTAGVEAEASGAVRTEAEQKESKERFETYGSRYRDTDDVRAHGGSLLGATFGQENVQAWADATCTNISAATDFTYFNPDNPQQLHHVGHGGKVMAFSPGAAGHCACDPGTGRVQGAWTITEGKQTIQENEKRLLGTDSLWDKYLHTFNELWHLSNRDQNKAQIISTLRLLVGEALPGVTVPSGLPIGLPSFWVNIDTAKPNWIGVTSPHLALCFPDNCWRWIMVNQLVIQTTPSHTQTVLSHELMHAADFWKAAEEFKRTHGPPPSGAGDRCKPVEKGERQKWTDPWGQYANDFIKFTEDRTGGLRHAEIYAQSAAPRLAGMSAQEKLDWFSGVISNLPPDLPSQQSFEAEQMVQKLFDDPKPEQLGLRQELARTLSHVAEIFILGDDQGGNVNTGKGRTLLDHFKPLWRLRSKEEQAILRKNL